MFRVRRLVQPVAATPQNTPDLAQTRTRSEAARMVPPQTAVAIASLRLALSIPRSDHALRHSRTTPRRLRLGASVNESLRSNFKFDRTRCFAGQSPLISVSQLFMTERSGSAQQGGGRL
jgi:hypothetical protein